MSGVLSADSDVCCHGDFQSTTNSVTIQRCDYKFRSLFEAAQCLIGVKAEEVLESGSDAIEHRNAGTSGEELLSVPSQDDDRHIIVESGLSTTALLIVE